MSKKAKNSKPKKKTGSFRSLVIILLIALAALGIFYSVNMLQNRQDIRSQAAGGNCCGQSDYPYCAPGDMNAWTKGYYACASRGCKVCGKVETPCDASLNKKILPITIKVGEIKDIGINPGSGKTIRVVCDSTSVPNPKAFVITINDDRTAPFACRIKGLAPGVQPLRFRVWKDPSTATTCYRATRVTVTN